MYAHVVCMCATERERDHVRDTYGLYIAITLADVLCVCEREREREGM